jgi:hypothetical protein
MQLKDFISETFKEIVDGVIAAQAYAGPKGARVSPAGSNCRTDQGALVFWDGATGEVLTVIEFDVAVTTTENSGTKGGIGVFVGPVGIGSQGQSSAGNSSISRIKFSVPIHLPMSQPAQE